LGDHAADDLDDLIRRVDPDRWLTSRFIGDAAARGDVIALYAYDYELARARRIASTPLMAEIRLTWWREALDEMFEHRPVRRHPTAEALAAAVARRRLPRAPLEAMIDGQIEALEIAALDAAGALAWADAVEGSAAQAAATILDPGAPSEAAAPAGRAWGLARLLRDGLAPRETLAPLLLLALDEARATARSLGVAALPAALHARLARFDLAGRQPGPLAARLALVLASATGRL
jgi:phytoene synthase